MTPLTALQETVTAQRGGIKSVAASLDMNYNQFYNHLFEVGNSKMSLNLAYRIEHMCGSLRVATVMAEPLGVVIPSPGAREPEGNPIQAIGRLMGDAGDCAKQVCQAIEDGVITLNEMRMLQSKATRLIEDAQALLKACEGLK